MYVLAKRKYKKIILSLESWEFSECIHSNFFDESTLFICQVKELFEHERGYQRGIKRIKKQSPMTVGRWISLGFNSKL